MKYTQIVALDDYEYIASLHDSEQYFLIAVLLTIFNESTELCVFEAKGDWHARFRDGSEYYPMLAPPSYDTGRFLKFVKFGIFHEMNTSTRPNRLFSVFRAADDLIIAHLEFDPNYKGGEAFSVELAYGDDVPDLANMLLGEYKERFFLREDLRPGGQS